MRTRDLWPLLVLVAVACAAEDEPEPTMDPATLAAEAFDPAGFDTISWESSDEATERGGIVYQYSCVKCHGPGGFGDGGFVQNGVTLRPPSFHQTGWEYAGDLEGLRRMIFTGREGGMPHWGLEGLKYRDVDAVSHYILGDLRSDGSQGS